MTGVQTCALPIYSQSTGIMLSPISSVAATFVGGVPSPISPGAAYTYAYQYGSVYLDYGGAYGSSVGTKPPTAKPFTDLSTCAPTSIRVRVGTVTLSLLLLAIT